MWRQDAVVARGLCGRFLMPDLSFLSRRHGCARTPHVARGAFAGVLASLQGLATGERYFVGSAAVTGGGIVFVGNDNGNLYVLDAEVEGMDADENDWMKMQPPENLEGIVCSSPALSTNVDGTGGLWLFVTSRKSDGTIWAFTVEEDTN